MVGIEFVIRLFTDDCVCYRQIDSIEYTSKFQKDIDQLGNVMGYAISAREM